MTSIINCKEEERNGLNLFPLIIAFTDKEYQKMQDCYREFDVNNSATSVEEQANIDTSLLNLSQKEVIAILETADSCMNKLNEMFLLLENFLTEILSSDLLSMLKGFYMKGHIETRLSPEYFAHITNTFHQLKRQADQSKKSFPQLPTLHYNHSLQHNYQIINLS